MGNLFAITTPAEDIKASADGKASAIFTVTNNTSKPLRGIARAKALEPTRQGWIDVEGETERDFGARGTQQFTVTFNRPAPSGALVEPAAKFPFRLDVASAVNSDEDFSEGPTVRVEVQSAAPPPPWKFPWWIVLVIAGAVLLGGGVALFLVMQKSCVARQPFAGTWKMPPPQQSSHQLIGIMKIEQSEKGELSAFVWKFGDAETGAPITYFTGQVTNGVGDLQSSNPFISLNLKCTIMDENRMFVEYTSQSSGFPLQTSQVLVRE